MSLETILLIGILTVLAIALGADCLWNLVIKSSWFDNDSPLKKADANSFLEIAENSQRLTNQFLVIIWSIVLVGTIALNIIPNSRLEPYLLKISLLSSTITVLAVLLEFGQINLNIAIKPILTSVSIGIRLISGLVAYWTILHYALNSQT